MKRSSGQLIFAVSILAFIVLACTTLSLAASKSATPKADRVEVRIKELHTALKITPEQEELWNNVAQVMRDNAKTMDTLSTARGNAKPMNAVESFKSYGEITEAQADGTKKFIPVFEALYNSMSDAQKKNADTVFAHRDHKKPKAKAKGK
jgi:protein CpxP